MSISKRAAQMNVSGIRKVFDLAAKMKNPVNLSIGQPDFDVSPAVKQSAIGAIQEGKNKYTLSAGIPELRRKLMDHLKSRGCPCEDLIVTSGVSGGIFLAVMALLDPGDEVLVPDPFFVMYTELPKLTGVRTVLVDTYPDFLLDPEKLRKAITPKTKMIFLNSPANPTGRICHRQDFDSLLRH